MRYRLDPGTFAGILAVIAVATAVFLLTLVTRSFSREQYSGEFDNIAPEIRSWFKSVRSPHGVPCCDIADGHRTDYDIRGDRYWVPIEGEMQEVPPEAVVYNAGNPYGQAVVWWERQAPGAIYIRCFVPGGGV